MLNALSLCLLATEIGILVEKSVGSKIQAANGINPFRSSRYKYLCFFSALHFSTKDLEPTTSYTHYQQCVLR